MIERVNLPRIHGKSRNLALCLKLAALTGIGLLPTAAAKTRLNQAENIVSGRKDISKSATGCKASELPFGIKKNTLFNKSTPASTLLNWVEEDKHFTEEEAADALLNDVLPPGSIFLINRDHGLAVCKATSDHNYEELVGKFPIEQGSTLVFKTAP